jgi:hypothetical protein
MTATLEQLQAQTPTTLSGIKTLAKKLKRLTGLQHSHALEAASRQAGFRNWHSALAALKSDDV